MRFDRSSAIPRIFRAIGRRGPTSRNIFPLLIVRPIAFVLTLPLTIVTLGLFIFILNAAMFGLVASMLDNFTVSGFWAAIFGSIIVSLTSTVASWYIGPDGKYEVYVIKRGG